MTRTRQRLTRLVVAAALVIPGIVASVDPSVAAPTEQDVAAAKAKLSQLQEQFAALNEQWNEARYQLQAAEDHLAEAKAMKDAAEQDAADARAQLSERAVRAYTDMGSQYEALLSADNMTEFSDRLEYIGAITQTDSDLAAEADATAQQADWAASAYDQAVAERQAKADELERQRQQAMSNLQDQEALASRLSQEYQDALAAQQAALAAPPPSDPTPNDTPPPSGGGGGYVPDPNATGAQAAIEAAKAVIGTPYVFGASGPDAFDCSGLTSWAWAHAGVYLPHSAASQYSSLPRVPLGEIQPGDIIYYGNFGPHVALYIGGGQIIHATHPGPGGGPHYDSLYGYDRPWGAVRPG